MASASMKYYENPSAWARRNAILVTLGGSTTVLAILDTVAALLHAGHLPAAVRYAAALVGAGVGYYVALAVHRKG
jgi:hypothetical protein